MTPKEQIKILAEGLRKIGQVAMPTAEGRKDALATIRRIADETLDRADMGPVRSGLNLRTMLQNQKAEQREA